MSRQLQDDWEDRARHIASNLSRAADELTRLIEEYRRTRQEKKPDDRPKP